MTTVLLDTNALVSFLTDRDEAQQQRVARLFRDAADGRTEVLLHQTVLTECVYVLTNLYDVEPREVKELLGELLSMPGMSTIHELAWPAGLDRWPEPYRDLADACLATVAREYGRPKIATFDQGLAKQLRREGLSTLW